MTREGFPDQVRDDLRYYLDRDGCFTSKLREHYRPFCPTPGQKLVYAKIGDSWIKLDHELLRKGMVVNVRDAGGGFHRWAGSDDQTMVITDIQFRDNQFAIRVRRATAQEIADAGRESTPAGYPT